MADAADRDAVTSGAIASVVVSALVPIALSLVGSAFLQGIIVSDVARGTLGERLTLRSLWRVAGRRLWPLVGWSLIVAGVLLGVIAILGGIVAALVISGGAAAIAVGVIVGVLGLIAVVVTGVWLYTKTSLVPSLIVLERLGIRASIRRSWSLTNGFFWRTFGVQFLVAAIVNIVSQVVTTPVSLVYGYLVTLIDPNGSGRLDGSAIAGAIASYAVLLLVSLVIGAVTTVVQASAIALIYIDLRMRKEGLDLHLVRYVESRQAGDTSVQDPYLTRA
jgi:membrane-anchored glycerophosphoryl diester phosphodiesterase (GDPDase)